MRDILRSIRLPAMNEGRPSYDLTLWDTGRRMDRGTNILGYDFRVTGAAEPLFTGEDYSHSPMDAIDSDRTVAGLLSFLTLRPGDTDDEYFENYTPEQRAFCAADAEDLSLYPYDVDDGRPATWENLDGWTTD